MRPVDTHCTSLLLDCLQKYCAVVIRATEILRKISKTNLQVQFIDVRDVFSNAQKSGKHLWVAPYYDPMHLTKEGNQVLAELVACGLLLEQQRHSN